MKTIRLILLLASLAGLCAVARADSANIRGILISASNESGQTDRRLAQYEPTLRRILRFESYRFLGDDSTSLEVPALGSLSIGDGHELELTIEEYNDARVRLQGVQDKLAEARDQPDTLKDEERAELPASRSGDVRMPA